MIQDFKRIAVRSFIKGLRDQALKTRFIGQQNDELSSLISIVEEAEEILEEPHGNVNVVSSTTPCSFCQKQQHHRDNRPRNQIRGTARELVCFKCNQPGHWARECQSNLGPGQASNLGREENPFNYENRPGNSNRPGYRQ
ncbi:hypothetical protein EVAR_101037_1 [Eumeta japonica]|uniref:CCHC-type domain-containing protein n=1 Tax=Eumeta variegata TaxID=151549 RepID=A0A4C1TL10_EUMVA|nr:hypothetical protein EVAR_101037_1 [Eumeta japonica]